MNILDLIFFTIFPVLSTACIFPAYFPQIIKTVKTKDVTSISPAFWWLIVGYVFFTWGTVVYTWFVTGRIGATAALTVNLTSAIIMLSLVYKYKK